MSDDQEKDKRLRKEKQVLPDILHDGTDLIEQSGYVIMMTKSNNVISSSLTTMQPRPKNGWPNMDLHH